MYMKANIIGRNIRIARAMKVPTMEQKDLLAKLQTEGFNISQSTLSKIEKGDRSVKDYELKIIAKALNVSITWLLEEPKIDNL